MTNQARCQIACHTVSTSCIRRYVNTSQSAADAQRTNTLLAAVHKKVCSLLHLRSAVVCSMLSGV
jgi:hypothetical protein